jgi:uncharacterized membrane protein
MTRWRPWVATIASVIGLGVATYLTYSHYTDPHELSLACAGSSSHGVINCQKVLTSANSEILGIPVALYGAIFFVFMLAINLPVAWRSPSLLVARLRLAAAVVGMGMVIYLVAVEALVVRALCEYCTSVHLMQFILFMLVITGWNDTGYAATLWEDDEVYEGDPASVDAGAAGATA